MTNSVTIMVMKKGSKTQGSIRVSVAQAKSQLSALLRTLEHQSVVIHNRGRDVARLVATENVERSGEPATPFVTFFNRLELIRKQTGVSGVNFRPAKANVRRIDPFDE